MSESSATQNRSPKRARLEEPATTTDNNNLPVVGLRIALIGPNHLTKLFAASLLKQEAPLDRSEWNLNDLLVLQELERRYSSSQQRIRSTVTERKYVHLYENGNNHHVFPNPCHMVYVVACDPRTFDSYSKNIYQHPSIQHILRDCQHNDLIHVSILLCLDVNAPAVDLMLVDESSPSPRFGYAPTIYTCWHPQLESSRQAVVQSLWKRCRISHRVGTRASPWIYEKVIQKKID